MVESNVVHLKIKTSAGLLEIDINPAESIEALKNLIFDINPKFEVNNQRLICKGQKKNWRINLLTLTYNYRITKK